MLYITITLSALLILSIINNIITSNKLRSIKNHQVELDDYKKQFNDIKSKLSEKLTDFNKRLSSNNGFIDVNSSRGTQRYTTRVYINEIERYTNGYSKLKINNMEVIHGLSNDIDELKKYVGETFPSITLTNNITWLVPEQDNIEMRRKKLDSLFDYQEEIKDK